MPTLLIVDDEQSIRGLLQDVFEDLGYTVLLAGHGREGLARLAQQSVDLILCDVMMPVMHGFSFVTQVRATPATREIPMVVMSAAIAAGALADERGIFFLAKPFGLPELLAMVAAALGDDPTRSVPLPGPDTGPTLSA